MAKYSGAHVGAILVGGYDFLVDTMEVSPVTVESVMEDTTTLGDSWTEQTPVGVRRGAFTQTGFYDDATGKLDAATVGLQNVSRVVSLLHEGNTVGKRFIGMAGAYSAKYDRVPVRGKLHRANVAYSVSGEVEQGVILHALGARTTTGNSEGADSQDAGASSASGGAGYLQVTAISGTGATLDAKVRHSSDDVTYADLVTFTQVALAATRAAERIAVSGTVNRHLAASWTIAGSSPSITFMVGFARG